MNICRRILTALAEREIEDEVGLRLKVHIDELGKKEEELQAIIDESQKIAERERAIMEKLASVESSKTDNDMVHVHVVFAIPLIENEETSRRAAAAVMQALAERIKAAVREGKTNSPNRG